MRMAGKEMVLVGMAPPLAGEAVATHRPAAPGDLVRADDLESDRGGMVTATATASEPFAFDLLARDTNIEDPPSNWLMVRGLNPPRRPTDARPLGTYLNAAANRPLSAELPTSALIASVPVTSFDADEDDDAVVIPDVMAPATAMKELFMAPYSSAAINLAVHRVGETIVIDGNVHPGVNLADFEPDAVSAALKGADASGLPSLLLQSPGESPDPDQGGNTGGDGTNNDHPKAAAALRPSLRALVPHPSFGGNHTGTDGSALRPLALQVPKKRNPRRAARRALYSKFLHHSLAAAGDAAGPGRSAAVADPGAADPGLFGDPDMGGMDPDFDPPTLALPQQFVRTFRWKFGDQDMVLGSNLLIFSNERHPSVSLRLQDLEREVTDLEALDYWLDNLFANVPELCICQHRNGVVQGYQLTTTGDIPRLGGRPRFVPSQVCESADAVLNFLKANCTRDGATYWLHREAGEDEMRLFDTRELYNNSAGDGRTGRSPADGEGFVFGSDGRRLADRDLPFAYPVALLCYRIGVRLLRSGTARHCSRARSLFDKAADLIDRTKYPDIYASICQRLADCAVLPPGRRQASTPNTSPVDGGERGGGDGSDGGADSLERSHDGSGTLASGLLAQGTETDALLLPVLEEVDLAVVDVDGSAVAVRPVATPMMAGPATAVSGRTRAGSASSAGGGGGGSSTEGTESDAEVDNRTTVTPSTPDENALFQALAHSLRGLRHVADCYRLPPQVEAGGADEAAIAAAVQITRPGGGGSQVRGEREVTPSVLKLMGQARRAVLAYLDELLALSEAEGAGRGEGKAMACCAALARACLALPGGPDQSARGLMEGLLAVLERRMDVVYALASAGASSTQIARLNRQMDDTSDRLDGMLDTAGLPRLGAMLQVLLAGEADCSQAGNGGGSGVGGGDGCGGGGGVEIGAFGAGASPRARLAALIRLVRTSPFASREEDALAVVAQTLVQARAAVKDVFDDRYTAVTRKLGATHNALGDVFLRSQRFTRALEQWQAALAFFREAEDDANVGLVHCNTGRLYRIRAQNESFASGAAGDAPQQGPMSATEEDYYFKAIEALMHGSDALGERRAHPGVWDTIHTQLGGTFLSLALRLKAFPPLHLRTRDEVDRSIAGFLQKAHINYELAANEPRVALAQFHMGSFYSEQIEARADLGADVVRTRFNLALLYLKKAYSFYADASEHADAIHALVATGHLHLRAFERAGPGLGKASVAVGVATRCSPHIKALMSSGGGGGGGGGGGDDDQTRVAAEGVVHTLLTAALKAVLTSASSSSSASASATSASPAGPSGSSVKDLYRRALTAVDLSGGGGGRGGGGSGGALVDLLDEMSVRWDRGV